jgi:hypothetical protein
MAPRIFRCVEAMGPDDLLHPQVRESAGMKEPSAIPGLRGRVTTESQVRAAWRSAGTSRAGAIEHRTENRPLTLSG